MAYLMGYVLEGRGGPSEGGLLVVRGPTDGQRGQARGAQGVAGTRETGKKYDVGNSDDATTELQVSESATDEHKDSINRQDAHSRNW